MTRHRGRGLVEGPEKRHKVRSSYGVSAVKPEKTKKGVNKDTT